MNNYKKIVLKKAGIHFCVKCESPVDNLDELVENARYGAYEFKMICDVCAEKIEDEMDQQQGN